MTKREGNVQQASVGRLPEGIETQLVPTVVNVGDNQQGLVEKHLLGFGLSDGVIP